MLGTDSKLVTRTVSFMVQFVKVGSYVGGIGALLLVDILFGAAYYSMALGGSQSASAEVGVQLPLMDSPVTAAAAGLFLSLATTAMQIIFWTLLVRKGSIRQSLRDPAAMFGFIGFAVIMIADTMADLGAVTHMIYPRTPRMDILPMTDGATMATGYLMVALIVVMMTAVNEPMLKMIMDRQKEAEHERSFA